MKKPYPSRNSRPASDHPHFRRFLSDLSDSIRGTDQDFTTGSLSRAIFLLSIPMVLEMLMESVFAVADIYFVSRLGPEAVAAVGITESLVTVVYAVGFGLSMATSALISRRIGEKRAGLAGRSAFQAILAGTAVSIPLALVGILWSSELLRLMGASHEISHELNGYTVIALGSNTLIMLLFIINAVFRSAGDAAISMRVLWMANMLNIVLDPCLIFGWGPFPELGITGAAIATATGRGLAVLYQFTILLGKRSRVRLDRSSLVFDPAIILKIFRLSLGGIGQNIIATASWIGLMRIVSGFGSVAVAGYTIAIRVIIFSLLPSWGMSNAASTLVGQNLGAGQPIRAEQSVWFTGRINMVMLGIISLLFIIIPSWFIQLFTMDEEVIRIGARALRIVSYGFFAYGLGMVLMQAFNGAGDTITPTKINLLCFWLVEIPLAWLLAVRAGTGESGVFYAITISESLLVLVAWMVFRKGAWKTNQV